MSMSLPTTPNERFTQVDDGKNASGWYEVIRTEIIEIPSASPHEPILLSISLCKFLDSAQEWEATVAHTTPRKIWRVLQCPVMDGIGNRVVTDWTHGVVRLYSTSSHALKRFEALVKHPYSVVTGRWVPITLRPMESASE